MSTPSVQILNVRIDNITTEELLRTLKKGVLVTPNIDHLVKCQKQKDFYLAAGRAEYSVCDSRVLQLLSKFTKNPIRETIPGSSFFPQFCDYHAKNQNVKIFLLGAKDGVADEAMRRINARVGRQMVVGAYSPPFGFEKEEKECVKIVDIINASGANVVLVGLGNPKQTIWIYDNMDKLPGVDIYMALGATIDFEAGNIKRAPKIYQKLGMEWLYRFTREPRRLFRRYFVEDMQFFYYFFLQLIGLYRDPFKQR